MLIQSDAQGNWCLKGVKWKDLQEGAVITKNTFEKLYSALWKLKNYEDADSAAEEKRVMAMSTAEAAAIFLKCFGNSNKNGCIETFFHPMDEVIDAIYIVARMETHNGISKETMLGALRYLTFCIKANEIKRTIVIEEDE